MALQIAVEQINEIFEYAERTYPEECCGLLLGRSSQSSGQSTNGQLSSHKTVVEVWETKNVWNADDNTLSDETNQTGHHHHLTKSRRYSIDPQQMLDAQRYARDRQLDIIGIYHSHPDHSAIPSECDRAAAWHQYSYMIVSVQHGKAKHVLSWTLDETDQFQSEEIQTAVPVSL
ncbi:MAG: M67 family metallopeptidase [Cyanobacteria bacterium J06626_14]